MALGTEREVLCVQTAINISEDGEVMLGKARVLVRLLLVPSMRGPWANDEFHGYGRLSSPDGCVYEGD